MNDMKQYCMKNEKENDGTWCDWCLGERKGQPIVKISQYKFKVCDRCISLYFEKDYDNLMKYIKHKREKVKSDE